MDKQGFALVVTVTIMILLSLIAVGLLSLSSTVLRASSASDARLEAQANARLALNLAIGELQKTLGDDRRISADASVVLSSEEATNTSHVVGVWESWSPQLSKNLTESAPNYENEKEERFLQWLVSGPTEELTNIDWVESPTADAFISLFSETSDGFNLDAPLVDIGGEDSTGSYAWAVVQENTKAKISVAGPEEGTFLPNNSLGAQPRPNVGIEEIYQQPEADWAARAAKVLDLQQARLDPDLAVADGDGDGVRSDIYTANSFGLLTDVVNGGLKVDLSLGFEMDESDFEAESWEEFENPFHSAAEEEFSPPSSYGSQRPLFEPQSSDGNFATSFSFDNGDPLDIEDMLPVVAVPTFTTLRSYYRIPKHLYESTEGITVFECAVDHIASPPESTPRSSSTHLFPARTMEGEETKLGIRPVLDRIMFVLSVGLSSSNEVNLIITPIVTLWNPYNIALEIEGAVAYPWLDVPFRLIISTTSGSGRGSATTEAGSAFFSGLVSSAERGGRSADLYLYAAITAEGAPLATNGGSTISFQPGEVRLFAPANTTPVSLNPGGQLSARRTFLRPVEDPNDLTSQGGFLIPARNGKTGAGYDPVVLTGSQSVKMEFELVNYLNNRTFPFAIGLEDATIATGSPRGAVRGLSIADVFSGDFTTTQQPRFESPIYAQRELSSEPKIFGVFGNSAPGLQ